MQFALYGLLIGLVYGLWALSFSLIYRTVRIFHVLHAAAFTVAAYGCWAVQHYTGAPFVVAAGSGLFLAAAIGVGAEILLYRPLLRLGAPAVLLFVSSLGAYIVVENVIQLIWQADVRSIPVADVFYAYLDLGGVGVSSIELLEGAVALALWLLTVALLRYTMIGKAIRAIAAAPEMAELAGIDRRGIRLFVFAYGSVLMGVSGLLFLAKLGIEPAAGLPVWVVAVVASLIAGAHPVYAFLSAIGIGFVETLGLIWIPARWQAAIPVFILLAYVAGAALWRHGKQWRIRRETRSLVRNG